MDDEFAKGEAIPGMSEINNATCFELLDGKGAGSFVSIC